MLLYGVCIHKKVKNGGITFHKNIISAPVGGGRKDRMSEASEQPGGMGEVCIHEGAKTDNEIYLHCKNFMNAERGASTKIRNNAAYIVV
jgi:hypothetical protein